MKERSLVVGFVVFVGLALLFMWYYTAPVSFQVSGALWGIPGTDPITPIMAALIVIWFLLVVSVVYLNRP